MADPAAAASPLRRLALCLQYEGGAYCGWQRQPRDPSVQETLEAALAQLDPLGPARAVAAGRTDSGVHAAGQVVHVDMAGPIPPPRWAAALNGRLPPSIRVRGSGAGAARLACLLQCHVPALSLHALQRPHPQPVSGALDLAPLSAAPR